MGDLETFLHGEPTRARTLIKAALAHAQFETIHPFLDGNGRVGRLLITLLLCDEEVLSRPLLSLSLYLKRHRDGYYDALQRVRAHGDWESWVRFFLEGVVDVAEEAADTTRRLVTVENDDRRRLQEIGRAAGTALRLHELAASSILITGPRAAHTLNVSEPTVYSAIRHLERLGILREMTGRGRNRVWAYERYLAILNEGT